MEKNTEFVYGFLNFENSFLFQKEVLGSCLNANVKDVDVKLYFPRISPNIAEEIKETSLFSKYIIAPDLNITNLNPKFKWGYLMSYPDMISQINNIIIAFPSGNEDEICNYIEEWLNLLFKYCKLISRIIVFNDNPNKIIIGGPLRLFSIVNNEVIKINRTYSSATLNIQIKTKENAISLNQLTLAIKLASNRPINLEDELILSAYNELENNNYRKCVIEAGTSLEVLLTKRIEEEFINQNITFGDKLLEKYKTLSGRFELLNALGVRLPTSDYKTKIIKHRNVAVHTGSTLTKETAKEVIKETEKYIDEFYPLK